MEEVSERVVDQRVRNRIMEVVEVLAGGDAAVSEVSFGNYFEFFYDWIPHRDSGGMYENSAVTSEERALLQRVSTLLDDASDDVPPEMTEEAFIATGWLGRIQPVAIEALALMRARGRFSEDREEGTPSG